METTCATEPGGEERWTGTTTPPASQTPAYAARSSGWLEMRTCTGSLAARPARDSASRTEPRGGEEIPKAHPRKGLARGKALRSLSEERSEIQARREIEKVGGWRSDCATTQ